MNWVSERRERAVPRAQFFTRADCSLCDRAYLIVRRLEDEGCLTVEKIDIGAQPALLEAYQYRIPVVLLSTGEVFEGRISEFRLRRALEALSDEGGSCTKAGRDVGESAP